MEEWKWMCEHKHIFFTLGLLAIMLCVLYSSAKKQDIKTRKWLADEYPEDDQKDTEHKL